MKFLIFVAELSLIKSVLVILLLTGGYYSLYYDDGTVLETQISDLQNQLAEEEKKKKDTEATIRKEDEMRANLAELARNLEVVKSKLPNELRDTDMTSMINKASNVSGLKVMSLAKKRSGLSPQSASIQGSESVEEVVFDITLMGVFNQLVQFLEVLAKEEKIMKIRDFKIDKSHQNLEDPTIRFTGDIIGFKQAQGAK